MVGSLRKPVGGGLYACSPLLLALALSLPEPVAARESAPHPSLSGDPLLLDPRERLRFLRSAEPGSVAQESSAPAAPAETPSPWAGTVELYGFTPLRTTNATTIQGFTAESSLSLGQLLNVLQATVSLRGSVENGRLGLLTDLSYVRLGAQKARERSGEAILVGDGRLRRAVQSLRSRGRPEAGGLVYRQRGELARRLAGRLARRAGGEGPIRASFRTELTAEQGIYDLALRYRLGAREAAVAAPGTVTVIPYAGIRLLDLSLGIDSSLSAAGFRERSIATAWGSPVAQPLLGTQAQVFLAPRLRLFARGDAAGFGISGSDSFSANAQVGVGYAVGNATQLDLSWRYLHMAANNGQSRENAYVIGQNGIELGLKFFF
jgi:hypothetical protein